MSINSLRDGLRVNPFTPDPVLNTRWKMKIHVFINEYILENKTFVEFENLTWVRPSLFYKNNKKKR